jgi:hypothetical protein
MSKGLSAFGNRGLSGVFGWENNEIHRRVWLDDPANQLVPLLQELFGEGDNPQVCPFPKPFNTFFAFSFSFDTTSDHGAQGETEDAGDFSLLQKLPTFRGGVTIDITYRPMDNSGVEPITDEAWDFSSQVMSLIGNNFGQNDPQSLKWSDGNPITNLTSIVKIIPKVELMQRRIFCPTLPNETQRKLIGQVNAGTLTMGAAGQGQQCQWPAGTMLLVGLPSVRRWRFDGNAIFEIGPKFAVNLYQDKLEDGSTGYVTWNRLYRPNKGYWDTVQVGPNKVPMYVGGDLTQVCGGF